jgi:hypothetical protein
MARSARNPGGSGTAAGALFALIAVCVCGASGCGVPEVSFVQDASVDAFVPYDDAPSEAPADAGASPDAQTDAGVNDAATLCSQPAPPNAALCCQSLWCIGCASTDCSSCETKCAEAGSCCMHGNLKCGSSCP